MNLATVAMEDHDKSSVNEKKNQKWWCPKLVSLCFALFALSNQ
jgi:hypothetical protein